VKNSNESIGYVTLAAAQSPDVTFVAMSCHGGFDRFFVKMRLVLRRSCLFRSLIRP